MKKVKEMIRELDKYKLQDKWVRFEKLSKNKKIDSETFQDEFIIIQMEFFMWKIKIPDTSLFFLMEI